MAESGSRVHHLQWISAVVAWVGAGAACYLLVADGGSTWWDRVMGGLLVILVVYGLRGLARGDIEEFAPTWRAGSIWSALVPFMFPMYLVWWADDRESRLVWLGWGLLAAAALVQIAIWRLERSRPDELGRRAGAWTR